MSTSVLTRAIGVPPLSPAMQGISRSVWQPIADVPAPHVEPNNADGTTIAFIDCVNDAECAAFLQWALPRLGLRWTGFRRVRGQVCKRLDRRMHALALSGAAAYKTYLAEHPTEWAALEALCPIPISRFYRDARVFDRLGEFVLPEVANRAARREPAAIRCWSAGCASGEEPYSLGLLWAHRVGPRYPQIALAIVATDVDEHLIERGRAACYARSSLRELPGEWINRAFNRQTDLYCLLEPWKACVDFYRQDIRVEQPQGPFDLVLCRNMAFTYFSEAVQRTVLARIANRLREDGFLVIGRHESLPAGAPFLPSDRAHGIYRKASSTSGMSNGDE